MTPPIDPLMRRFRVALADLYGERLERVVLFGSRARGDATAGSDYDVAVFVKDLGSFGFESGRLAEVEVEVDLLIETGAVINALPFEAGAYRTSTGFMHEVRRDGLDL